MVCRKILMHLAVEKGAKPGGTFQSYFEHLAANGYVPPGGEGWVEYVRQRSNEANHEIVIMADTDSTALIKCVEMLLRFIYEFPRDIPPPINPVEDG
jgi:hypothetical protein